MFVDRDDAVDGGLDDRLEMRRRFGDSLFRFFNDRDIAVDLEDHIALRPRDALHAAQHRDPAAALLRVQQTAVPLAFPINFRLDLGLRDRKNGFEHFVNRPPVNFTGRYNRRVFPLPGSSTRSHDRDCSTR